MASSFDTMDYHEARMRHEMALRNRDLYYDPQRMMYLSGSHEGCGQSQAPKPEPKKPNKLLLLETL